MTKSDDFRRGRHCVSALHVHLVFVTKYRRNVLNAHAIEAFEAELIECNGEDDHVHLLVRYPPKVALAKLVNSLKGVSSRLLRKELRPYGGDTTKGCCGPPHTLLHLVEAHLWRSSDNMSRDNASRARGAPNLGLNAEACGAK